jgi:hypothetical protein
VRAIAKVLAAGFTFTLVLALAVPASFADPCPPLDPTCATDSIQGVPEIPEVPPLDDLPDPLEDAKDDVEDAIDDVEDAVDDIVDPDPDEEPDPDEGPVEDDPRGDDDRSGGGGAGGGRSGGSGSGSMGPSLSEGRLGEVNPGSPTLGGAAVASRREAPSASGGISRAAARAAKEGAFPLALILIVLAYTVVQDRMDRRDPKLALAPVRADDLSFA